jgi:hypothetical protein
MKRFLTPFAMLLIASLLTIPAMGQDGEGMAEADHSYLTLPRKGVFALRQQQLVGGVAIHESRAMGLVLSHDPLVIVTTAQLLNHPDAELVSPIAVNSEFSAQDYIPVYGGMGGMMGGGIMGGMSDMGPPVSSRMNWTALDVVPLLLSDSAVSSTEEPPSSLLFLRGTRKNDIEPRPAPAVSLAKLAVAPVLDASWACYGWHPADAEHPMRFVPEGQNPPASGVAVSPTGSVALIIDNKLLGRQEIMQRYLEVYKQRQKVAQSPANDPFSSPAVAADDPFSSPGVAGDDPFGGPARKAGPQASGPSQPSGGSSADTGSVEGEAIVQAVVAVKTAKDAAARASASERLRELLSLEFDAQRNVKRLAIESLRQRLQQLDQAEQASMENRERILRERVQFLLNDGTQSPTSPRATR